MADLQTHGRVTTLGKKVKNMRPELPKTEKYGILNEIRDWAGFLLLVVVILAVLALLGWGAYGLVQSGRIFAALFSLVLIGLSFYGGTMYGSCDGTTEGEATRRTVVAILWFAVGFLFSTAPHAQDEGFWPAWLIGPMLLVFSWGMSSAAQQRRDDYMDELEGRGKS